MLTEKRKIVINDGEISNITNSYFTDIINILNLQVDVISAEPRVYLGVPFTRVTVNLD